MPPGGLPYNRNVQADTPFMHVGSSLPRSAYDVSHTHKTTFNAGNLIPLYVDEVLPGDSIRVKATVFARLATLVVPVMDNMYLESFFFFVPNRLLWDNWKRFMGEQSAPADTTVFLLPQVTLTPAQLAFPGIANWFGISNNGSVNNVTVNALPFRAYNLIWNEWFRDEDLELPRNVNKGDGPDVAADYVLLTRAKRPDYFTVAKPWPQKPLNQGAMWGEAYPATYVPGQNMALGSGDPDFGIRRFGIGAPVSGLGIVSGQAATVGAIDIMQTGSRVSSYAPHWRNDTDVFLMASDQAGLAPDVRVLINDIRTAVAVQRMMETNARGGTRYIELVYAHFGVRSPDARLQRPEFLGGGRTRINVNPVAQTSESGGTVQGHLAGIGTVVGGQHGFSQSFTEHGYILGLFIARADLTYQQGVNRMWFRRTQFDFFWPGLAHLGEQAIMSREIFCDGSAGDLNVFGYTERYSEYKYKPSIVTGAFQSFTATPLDMWHFSQYFTARPVLNPAFIQDPATTTLNRALQVTAYDNQQFLCDALFEIRYARVMPMFSLPGVGIRM